MEPVNQITFDNVCDGDMERSELDTDTRGYLAPEAHRTDSPSQEPTLSGTKEVPVIPTPRPYRRPKISLSPQSQVRLENVFVHNRFPDDHTTTSLSEELGIPEKIIFDWFHTKRQATRRQNRRVPRPKSPHPVLGVSLRSQRSPRRASSSTSSGTTHSVPKRICQRRTTEIHDRAVYPPASPVTSHTDRSVFSDGKESSIDSVFSDVTDTSFSSASSGEYSLAHTDSSLSPLTVSDFQDEQEWMSDDEDEVFLPNSVDMVCVPKPRDRLGGVFECSYTMETSDSEAIAINTTYSIPRPRLPQIAARSSTSSSDATTPLAHSAGWFRGDSSDSEVSALTTQFAFTEAAIAMNTTYSIPLPRTPGLSLDDQTAARSSSSCSDATTPLVRFTDRVPQGKHSVPARLNLLPPPGTPQDCEDNVPSPSRRPSLLSSLSLLESHLRDLSSSPRSPWLQGSPYFSLSEDSGSDSEMWMLASMTPISPLPPTPATPLTPTLTPLTPARGTRPPARGMYGRFCSSPGSDGLADNSLDMSGISSPANVFFP